MDSASYVAGRRARDGSGAAKAGSAAREPGAEPGPSLACAIPSASSGRRPSFSRTLPARPASHWALQREQNTPVHMWPFFPTKRQIPPGRGPVNSPGYMSECESGLALSPAWKRAYIDYTLWFRGGTGRGGRCLASPRYPGPIEPNGSSTCSSSGQRDVGGAEPGSSEYTGAEPPTTRRAGGANHTR